MAEISLLDINWCGNQQVTPNIVTETKMFGQSYGINFAVVRVWTKVHFLSAFVELAPTVTGILKLIVTPMFMS